MKAFVWLGGPRCELGDREAPPLGPQDARVEVRAAGICATDLHMMDGRLSFGAPPKVLGHEIAGVVVEAGRGVERSWIGRRVAVDPVLGCGACAYCAAGRKLLCRAGGELGTTGGDGGYAEQVTVPAANLHELPEPLSFEEGALIEPLDCTLGAFLRAAPRSGESVLVLGSGPAGLLFVELARAHGCGPVLLVGGGETRLALARRLGASEAWDHRDGDLDERVREATAAEGPDITVEAVGADESVGRAFAWVRRGGRVVLYGLPGHGRPNIPADSVVSKDLTVTTGIGSPELWGESVRLAAAGRVDLGALVTHRFPLDRACEALAAARDVDRAVKVVLHPHPPAATRRTT